MRKDYWLWSLILFEEEKRKKRRNNPFSFVFSHRKENRGDSPPLSPARETLLNKLPKIKNLIP